MSLIRIQEAKPLEAFRLRLKLTDGSVIERDVSNLMVGPIFEEMKSNSDLFRQVKVENGTVAWPNGADLCPDVLIWGGAPPKKTTSPPKQLVSDKKS
jgi:hypothetical protein